MTKRKTKDGQNSQNSQNSQKKNLPVYRGSIKGYKKFVGKVSLWNAEGKKYVLSGVMVLFGRKYKVYLFKN